MINFTPSLIISIFSLLISGLSFYLHFKDSRKNEPKLKIYLQKSHYKKIQDDKIKIIVEVLFENKSKSNSSISDLRIQIRDINKKKDSMNSNIIESPVNHSKVMPFDINGYSSVKKKFEFDVKGDLYYFMRGQMPIDFRNPKKWIWEDLPIIFELYFISTFRKETLLGYAFREDQEESKEIRGSFNQMDLFRLSIGEKINSKR